MTWNSNAKKAMQDNPDYFVWWYTAKSIGLGVAAAVAAYYIGKDRARREGRGSFGGLGGRGPLGLGALPEFPMLKFTKSTPITADGEPDVSRFTINVFERETDERVGYIEVNRDRCDELARPRRKQKGGDPSTGYASVGEGWIVKKWRGKGLYPVLLTKARDEVKSEGCKGLMSFGAGRVGVKSTESWEKFRKVEPRVRVEARYNEVTGDYWDDYYFDGLHGLGDLPTFPGLKFKMKKQVAPDGEGYVYVMDVKDSRGASIAHLEALSCMDDFADNYAPINGGFIEEKWRGKGLYPVMLSKMRDYAQARGCAGLVSLEVGRVGEKSTESWQKFAEREARVKRKGRDYYLDGLLGLPTKGRIPLATAKRALKQLPKKSQACEGMSAAKLREGMEIEREHRDLTKGRVGQTAKIAAAHICERSDYYKRIKKFVE